jgi:uncharacterized protein YdeI (YjbR/CyaY-like superfamily)
VDIGETLYVTGRKAWRDWLEAHHASKPEVWLVFHTKASGKPSIPYNYAVEEALCYGWIDSIVKKLGPDSRAQRFTPRRPGSPMSEMNKARVRRLAEAGLVSPFALESLATTLDEPYQVPADIVAALQADETVWRNFQAFPESYKRIRVGWIDGSRDQPEVFRRRLDYFVRMTRQNKRYGMVQ